MSRLTPQQRSAWADHIQTQRESGLTQQVYCQQHSLKPHQFWYWKRKLAGGTGKKLNQPGKPEHPGFVPVSIATRALPQDLSIPLPHGIPIDAIAAQNRLLAPHLIGAWK